MKYKLILNFQVKQVEYERFKQFIEKLMEAFRAIFPDATESSEPFATLQYDETPVEKNSIGDAQASLDRKLFPEEPKPHD